MACGTPILAFKKGSVPEVVVDGKTGFVVDSLGAMIGALDHIDSIDPHECRRHVQSRFSMMSMACKYSDLYQQIIDNHKILYGYSRLPTDYLSKPLLPGATAT
jgi:glycosyltransferase involved in cell wall biosynthesis